jgi:hypothetical protein
MPDNRPLNVDAATSVISSITLHLLMEHDAKEEGDIINEVKAHATVVGIINGTLAIAGDQTATMAAMAANVRFDEELEKRNRGEGYDMSKLREAYRGKVGE